MVIVFCGCRSDWVCERCAKCATCCLCDIDRVSLVHSNSLAGASAIRRESWRRKQEQTKALGPTGEAV